jgi:hypothetical protein
MHREGGARSAFSKIADGSRAGGKLGISLCAGLGFFVLTLLARRKNLSGVYSRRKRLASSNSSRNSGVRRFSRK